MHGSTVVVEEQEDTILPIESTSRMWNENRTRSISYGGSVGGEMDDEQSILFINTKEGQQVDEQEEERLEEHYEDEQQAEEQPLKNHELSNVHGETRSRRSAPTGVVNSHYDLSNRRHERVRPETPFVLTTAMIIFCRLTAFDL